MKQENQVAEVVKVIEDYFSGLYHGDISKLQEVFHSESKLFGYVKDSEHKKSLDEYIDVVKGRQSPAQLLEPFEMKILSLEVAGNIAMARLHVPMLGFKYCDYLSLCKVDKQWKIVNKIFTDAPGY
jgi:hypothetical protein